MKKLYLLRHADAESKAVEDASRQLSNKGQTESTMLSNAMTHKNISCDAVFCSAAVRAGQTCDTVIPSIQTSSVQKKEELYYIDLNRAVEFIKNLNESYNSVLIVSHNPTLSELATKLTGDEVHFSTGTLKYLELDIDSWKDITSRCGRLIWSLPN